MAGTCGPNFLIFILLLDLVLGSRTTESRDNPYSHLLDGSWGRIFVREVRNCFEAVNESTIVSSECDKTELRQVWRYNDQRQIENFYYKQCLAASALDGRDNRVELQHCSGYVGQQWSTNDQILDDFTISSTALQLCLDVNGYAVVHTALVQMGACEPAFDSAGRISDQYLQFEVAYDQITISTTDDSITSKREPARVSCQLHNSPSSPNWVVWTNGVVQIEEFTTKTGYSISTGVYYNNSMLSILTIKQPHIAESWTCFFIVDQQKFSAVTYIDIPEVSCTGVVAEESLTASMKCCYMGKHKPTNIYWQKEGKSVRETEKIYQVTVGEFVDRSQCTTVHFSRTSSELNFTVTFQTTYKDISKTVISGPTVPAVKPTSPAWVGSEKTTFPNWKIINEVEEQDKNKNSTAAESIQNACWSMQRGSAFVLLLQMFLHVT